MKKENLVHHIKVVHTQEKEKLQCNWCGKTYQSEHAYKNITNQIASKGMRRRKR